MIFIEGSLGEGGGQILRTSLTLSMITGHSFTMKNIRAKRSKPGILRQHLVAIRAAAQVCGATVDGDMLGSTNLTFSPGKLTGGKHRFDIGSAGSSTLVLQTLIPALLYANEASEIEISGGTHNPMAPPFEALDKSYLRVLRTMGADIALEIHRFGFFPAGGGLLKASVQPSAPLQPIKLIERGELVSKSVMSLIANIPESVAQKELGSLMLSTGWDETCFLSTNISECAGPGNALIATLEYENVTEVFWCPGQKRVSSGEIAKEVFGQIDSYMNSTDAALGEHLADQVMLPMALSGSGSFSAIMFSDHATTNAQVIKQFLPVEITFTSEGGVHSCNIRSNS